MTSTFQWPQTRPCLMKSHDTELCCIITLRNLEMSSKDLQIDQTPCEPQECVCVCTKECYLDLPGTIKVTVKCNGWLLRTSRCVSSAQPINMWVLYCSAEVWNIFSPSYFLHMMSLTQKHRHNKRSHFMGVCMMWWCG